MKSCSCRLILLLGCICTVCCAGRRLKQEGWVDGSADLTVSLNNLDTRAERRFNWAVETTADKDQVVLQADGSPQQIGYAVTFTRTQEALTQLVLSGKLLIQNNGQESADISLPNITIATRTTKLVLPTSTVHCPALTVPASEVLACTFTATYRGRHPTAGHVTAAVTVQATDGTPAKTTSSKALPFDFTRATLVTVGDSATVSNWFARAEGDFIQPDNVGGQQPDELLIGDSRTFRLVAYFSARSNDSTNCGRTLKVVSTAQVTPTNLQPGEGPPEKPRRVHADGTVVMPSCDSWKAASDKNQLVLKAAQQTPCGGAGMFCAAGERCFNGIQCCPVSIPVCGGKCCGGDWRCEGDVCVPAGSTVCGTSFCFAGTHCVTGATPVCVSDAATPQTPAAPQQPNTVVVVPWSAPAPAPVWPPTPYPLGPEPCGVGPVARGVSCPAWQRCADAETGLCCLPGQIPCFNECCSPTTHVCNRHHRVRACVALYVPPGVVCTQTNWCPTHPTGGACCPQINDPIDGVLKQQRCIADDCRFG